MIAIKEISDKAMPFYPKTSMPAARAEQGDDHVRPYDIWSKDFSNLDKTEQENYIVETVKHMGYGDEVKARAFNLAGQGDLHSLYNELFLPSMERLKQDSSKLKKAP